MVIVGLDVNFLNCALMYPYVPNGLTLRFLEKIYQYHIRISMVGFLEVLSIHKQNETSKY